MEVVAGRAHLKHTEGGDFRQTTYRAVRHGLMQSKSVLLEPFYHFEILVPDTNTGRVMSDVERMKENCAIDETKDRFTRLSGRCPVSTMKNYMNEIRAFSKGLGNIFLAMDGYDLCHKVLLQELCYQPLC